MFAVFFAAMVTPLYMVPVVPLLAMQAYAVAMVSSRAPAVL